MHLSVDPRVITSTFCAYYEMFDFEAQYKKVAPNVDLLAVITGGCVLHFNIIKPAHIKIFFALFSH